MHDLTGFQRDILYIIAGIEEPHGLAVKAELDDYYEQEINHGRLYPISTTSSTKDFSKSPQQTGVTETLGGLHLFKLPTEFATH